MFKPGQTKHEVSARLRLQLAFEVVQKPPTGAVGDNGCGLDLMKPASLRASRL